MKPIILENECLRIALCDPADQADTHLHTRFSHCGYILSIKDRRSGRELLAQPTEQFHPFHGEGFPDEFEKPLGYDEAAPGGEFLKVGVGIEEKKADVPYSNWDEHPVTQKAVNTVKITPDAAAFSQTAQLGTLGYAYTKQVVLEGGTFRISHCLQNTGKTVWDTLWYSHCFLPVKPLGHRAVLRMNPGCTLRQTTDDLTCGTDSVQIVAAGHGTQGPCFQWDVAQGAENYQQLYSENGAAVYGAWADHSCQQLQLYVNDRIVSVEPKLIFSLASGEKKVWSTTYSIP